MIHYNMNEMRGELPPINGRVIYNTFIQSSSRDLNDTYNEMQLIKLSSTLYRILNPNSNPENNDYSKLYFYQKLQARPDFNQLPMNQRLVYCALIKYL